jgi:hypothetical protein
MHVFVVVHFDCMPKLKLGLCIMLKPLFIYLFIYFSSSLVAKNSTFKVDKWGDRSSEADPRPSKAGHLIRLDPNKFFFS